MLNKPLLSLKKPGLCSLAALLGALGGCVVSSPAKQQVCAPAAPAGTAALSPVLPNSPVQEESDDSYAPAVSYKEVIEDGESEAAPEEGEEEAPEDATGEEVAEDTAPVEGVPFADANVDATEVGHVNAGGDDGLLPSVSKRDLSSFQIRAVHNPWVQKWIEYFTVQGRGHYSRYIERGARYRTAVEEILKQHGVPPELYYLALIESGFAVHAKSTASAVGIWQFISGTGRRYGLRINRYVDERKDFLRATEAAARYLRDLHNVYQSWYLALASYNCGEVCVMNAVFRGGSRDFWTLADQRLLPKETSNYVPKFIAAMIIGENMEQYGFERPTTQPFPKVRAVQVPAPVNFRHIAEAFGVEESVLQELNPHLGRRVTPPLQEGNYDLWLPAEVAEGDQVAQAVAGLASHRESLRVAREGNPNWHVVSRGETLATIAQDYHLTTRQIRKMNGMRSSRVHVGQRLRVSGKASANVSASEKGGGSSVHVVRRGETLQQIARRYGVTVSSLKSANKLRSTKLRVGMRIVVPQKNADLGSAKASRLVPYKVRRGDTLQSISTRFGVSARKIKTQNGLRNALVYAGQVLRIPTAE